MVLSQCRISEGFANTEVGPRASSLGFFCILLSFQWTKEQSRVEGDLEHHQSILLKKGRSTELGGGRGGAVRTP